MDGLLALIGVVVVLLLGCTLVYEGLDVLGIVGEQSCEEWQAQEGPYAPCHQNLSGQWVAG